MLSEPISLLKASQLRDPSERVALDQHNAYIEGCHIVEDKAFMGHELQAEEPLQLRLFFKDDSAKGVVTRITEEKLGGELVIQTETAPSSDQYDEESYRWAAFKILWSAISKDQHTDVRIFKLAKDLKEPLFVRQVQKEQGQEGTTSTVHLDSISLFLDDMPLLKGPYLGQFLTVDVSDYHREPMGRERELLSPSLWNMPEVYRRTLTAYSEHYQNEVKEQNRLADIIRYNFSNGTQISAKEILRHPLQKRIPRELLPQPKPQNSAFSRWPLAQQKTALFISQNIRDLEQIIQAQLAAIATKVRQGQLQLFLQNSSHREQALQVRQIEFDAASELYWRVEFSEKEELETEFKLMSQKKKDFFFYDSFALEPESGTLLVHPWLREIHSLEDVITHLSVARVDENLAMGQMPRLNIKGELEAKVVLRHLRKRGLPVDIGGESVTVPVNKTLTEIQIEEAGLFILQHDIRVSGRKNLKRKGWTPQSLVFLQTLSQGLPYWLSQEARDIASRARRKREWDLKLLKHLGILQYIALEALSVYYDGVLTDGRAVKREDVLHEIQSKIQTILVSGTGTVLAREMTLSELCSQPVLQTVQDFISHIYKMLSTQEAFFSENGEVIVEGLVEREGRLILELLKALALSTGGEAFKKTRTSFLSKIWTGDAESDLQLATGHFFFPKSARSTSQVFETIDYLQSLISHGYKIFYRGQALQELQDDEFQVDFALTEAENRGDFNWFELNPRFFLRGEEIDPKDMAGFGSSGVIEYAGKMYLVPRKQIPSLRRLENFWLKLQKGKKESSTRQEGAGIYQLPRHQVLELLALRSSGYKIRGDEEWKRLCDFYDKLGSEREDINLPASIHASLKHYQTLGVQWLQDLYNLKLGALLADDMGLGKTLQTLAFLEDLRVKKKLGQVLVIVPSSLIFNWQSEVEKFTPELPLTVFSSRDIDRVGKRLEAKEDLIVLTTYGLLMENEHFLTQYNWNVLIFDEAQNLKNITTKRTSSARSLNAQFKICLTGTPMENHYGEFYSLVDLLVPGSLGKVEDFRRQFVNTELVSKEQIEDLKLKIKPLLLRRTKKEILDQLPEKQETKVSIAFEEKQKEIYRDIALSYNQKVQENLLSHGEASVQLQMLTALLRLRQACSDPGALPNIRYTKVPPKLETLMDSLSEIVESGESALVFTQFLQTLEHTAKILKEANIPVYVLHGGVPTKQRQKILADFNKEPGGAVLVMTLKTGGVGLNLTKASYVFHLEPWWNPSVENQATDRAHRLGQSKAVQVFRYIMHESLEEKIELLKSRKDAKFQNLFAASEQESDLGPGSGGLSKEDFDLLLGLK